MIGAQNQAAVDGACALRILRDLRLNAATFTLPAPEDQHESGHFPFSVVTEGPTQELWVHYHQEEEFHMTPLRIWRTTSARDSREFIQALFQILTWGVHEFRPSVVGELTVIETALRERNVN
ncbi:hypothetical protein BS50DRAFT_318532 [Corynespora cassiicola Philippines]|uniref:Uncharacterized protein n=1 Tax=Corynespora cassiicola Philippines TaxID=1448308 RepID=A0A2T2N0B6_CORCC|nr:hypothetical protein BS50DRAFT_318532 [Corynespora cassiicola Philippines]